LGLDDSPNSAQRRRYSHVTFLSPLLSKGTKRPMSSMTRRIRKRKRLTGKLIRPAVMLPTVNRVVQTGENRKAVTLR